MNPPDNSVWKRALKCGISCGVFSVSAIGMFFARLFGKSPKGSCVVLYYHSVPASEQRQFADQLDVLLRHAKPIEVGGPIALTRAVHHVGVTFDDGFENFAECALPELEKRNIPATVFFISNQFGKMFGPSGNPEKVMSLDQMKQLPSNLVTIGSHTVSHPFLPSINGQDARAELVESRKQLEKMCDRSVSLFSFPFGGFNEQLLGYCREAGYQRAFTTLPTFAFSDPDEFEVGRVRVDPTDWPLEFRLKLAGAYRWLPIAFAIKKKIRRRTGMKVAQDVAAGNRTT
jgi:peptidoglycan/xylan/chitin deacetylase (PgdA/CDA1 family)